MENNGGRGIPFYIELHFFRAIFTRASDDAADRGQSVMRNLQLKTRM
jgi:hypothetical protein